VHLTCGGPLGSAQLSALPLLCLALHITPYQEVCSTVSYCSHGCWYLRYMTLAAAAQGVPTSCRAPGPSICVKSCKASQQSGIPVRAHSTAAAGSCTTALAERCIYQAAAQGQQQQRLVGQLSAPSSSSSSAAAAAKRNRQGQHGQY
jgi:hypothetical protein